MEPNRCSDGRLLDGAPCSIEGKGEIVTAGRVQSLSAVPGAMPPADAWQMFVNDMDKYGAIGQGEGITVAIVDSGVDMTDPVVKAAVVGGRNLVPGENPDDLQDQIRHGSLVARIILTLAPKVKLYVVKIFGREGSCSDDLVGAGLELAAKNAHITNASIGGDDSPQARRGVAAHEFLRIPLVAAAGNSGDGNAVTQEPEYPASYDYPIAVGAVDRGPMVDPTDARFEIRPSGYSASYPKVDCVAMGRIPGSWDDGTSFAAPAVTAMLARHMGWARATGRPSFDPDCYSFILNHSRQLPGLAAKNDQTGYGFVTLRPRLNTVEIDVDTMEATINGAPCNLKADGGIENRAPGGLYGWLRPFANLLGIRVEYDPYRRKGRYIG